MYVPLVIYYFVYINLAVIYHLSNVYYEIDIKIVQRVKLVK